MAPSYQVIMPHQITPDMPNGSPIRLVGRVKEYIPSSDLLLIEYKSVVVRVDTSCLEALDYGSCSQMEIFGDLYDSSLPDDTRVEAKIARPINDADLNLYERIVPLLRKYRDV